MYVYKYVYIYTHIYIYIYMYMCVCLVCTMVKTWSMGYGDFHHWELGIRILAV